MALDATGFAAFASGVVTAIESIWGCTCLIGTTGYAAARRGARRSSQAVEGAIMAELDEVFRVRKAVLATVPSVGTKIIVTPDTFRVVETRERPSDPCWWLGCEQVYNVAR